jgi:hypothetical protein
MSTRSFNRRQQPGRPKVSRRRASRGGREIADYADLVVMPTLVLDRLRGKGMRGIVSA